MESLGSQARPLVAHVGPTHPAHVRHGVDLLLGDC